MRKYYKMSRPAILSASFVCPVAMDENFKKDNISGKGQ